MNLLSQSPFIYSYLLRKHIYLKRICLLSNTDTM